MYQPPHGRFTVADPTSLLTQLSAVAPATLVTTGPDGFRTSILPMLFDPTEGDHGVLRGHLARQNTQWSDEGMRGDGASAIAMFHGPDAYISPTWYEEKSRTGRVVPTWNYVVIVIHGTLIVHDDTEWLLDHVRLLVDRHEADRPDPWSVDDAPDGYVRGQAKGIVGLELRIDRIEAKGKLSQNRSPNDVSSAAAGLAMGSPMEQLVAAAMRSPDEPVVHSRPHGKDREE